MPNNGVDAGVRTQYSAAETQEQTIGESLPATDQPQDAPRARHPVDPIPPDLVVAVRSEEEIVSRSVEGNAEVVYRSSQAALSDAVLDLRGAEAPAIRIESDRSIHVLAASILADAGMVVNGENVGLSNTTLLSGEDTRTIGIAVLDDLNLGLSAASSATAAVMNRTLAMDGSQLVDGGGIDSLGLSARTQLHFTVLGNPETSSLAIELVTQAMNNSSVLLGSADNRVTIESGYTDRSGSEISLDVATPTQQGTGVSEGDVVLPSSDPLTPVVRLTTTAIGLANSMIDTGAGNDHLTITTTLDDQLLQTMKLLSGNTIPEISQQRIGLLDSEVFLGEGNDALWIDAAVSGSTIDPGSGTNSVRIDGPVEDSTLQVSSGSINSVLLGPADDSLAIEAAGPSELHMQLGGGADRLVLQGATPSGELGGGDGYDSLQLFEAPPPAGPARVANHLVLEGPDRGWIDQLAFQGIEQLDLGSGDDLVTVNPGGSLSGSLQGGVGNDRLDYGSWLDPVNVNLESGSVSAIDGVALGFEEVLGGQASDYFVVGTDTAWIDGNAGDDVFLLDWSLWTTGIGPSSNLIGGAGNDRFLLVFPDAFSQFDGTTTQGLPVLADIGLTLDPNGGIGLTDQLSWLQGQSFAYDSPVTSLPSLIPAGVAGIGDATLLPIAPLDQLLAGIGSSSGSSSSQLVIATGDLGSQLLLLSPDGSLRPILDLPTLVALPVIPSPASSATGPA